MNNPEPIPFIPKVHFMGQVFIPGPIRQPSVKVPVRESIKNLMDALGYVTSLEATQRAIGIRPVVTSGAIIRKGIEGLDFDWRKFKRQELERRTWNYGDDCGRTGTS
jgi:hypothetical protein